MYKIIKSNRHCTLSWTSKRRWKTTGSEGSWFYGLDLEDLYAYEVYVRLIGFELTIVA